MKPEDSVLVGVINRKKDFKILREQGWYRIPVAQMAHGIHEDYIAFFFSRAFRSQNGSIRYFAERGGYEQLTRAEMLPDEAKNKNASKPYYKVNIGALQAKVPPILNESNHRISFIYTTGERFQNATKISQLFLGGDDLVNPIFDALEDEQYQPTRRWQLEQGYPLQSAQLRVLCESGEVLASTHPDEGIPITDDVEGSLDRIKREVAARGGPLMISTPLE
jgi:hypothetical protein